MHLAFAVLPSVGAGRAISTGEIAAPLAIAAAALIVAVYAGGTWQALRTRDRAPVGADPRLPGAAWTLALTVTWAAATLMSSAFVWVAFPLFFLLLFALPGWAGIGALVVVTLWAAGAPMLSGDPAEHGLGEFLGPVVGAVFSVVAHAVYRQVLREVARNRRLVADLHATRADLADSERRKGVVEERERLAQDIHDTLAQGMNSIVLRSRSARAAHPAAAAEFTTIEETARANLADARSLVRDLSARTADATLEQQLAAVIAQAERADGDPALELRIEGAPRHLTAGRIETVHRAAQSLVANVVQHADADRCVLTLTWWDDRVTLDVVDDGRGFDPAETVSGHRASPGARVPAGDGRDGSDGGDGLRLLRSRIARAGGTLVVDSAPGEGTTVGIGLPTGEPQGGRTDQKEDR